MSRKPRIHPKFSPRHHQLTNERQTPKKVRQSTNQLCSLQKTPSVEMSALPEENTHRESEVSRRKQTLLLLFDRRPFVLTVPTAT